MSTAILTGPPVPGAPLADDLRALGFDVRVVDEAPELVEALGEVPAGQRVAVVDSRFVGHRHSLRLGLTDPRFPAAAIPGAVTVAPPSRAVLLAAATECARAEATTETATEARAREPDERGGPALRRRTACLPDELAHRLGDAGTPLHRPELGTLVATVPADAATRVRAEAALAEVDEEAVRLRSAVKARDGFFTTYCVSPYSRYLARFLARRGLTPNQVTTASLLTALVAAGLAATGSRPGFVAAALLLLGSFVLDCADGQLARYTLRYSTLGAWLDATFDRAKEYAFYAGLALGAANSGDDVWVLALAAMVLQTGRHTVDFAFTEGYRAATPAGGATGPAAGGVATPVAALSGRLDRIAWTVWLRRAIVLPIGERWALLAVLTALTTPRTALTVLLVAGGLAACYTTAGRLLRSRRATRLPEPAPAAVYALTDTGPLAEAVAARVRRVVARLPAAYGAPLLAVAAVTLLPGVLLATAAGGAETGWWALALAAGYALCAGAAVARPLAGPFDWLLPPLFRLGEYGTVLLLAHQAQENAGVNGVLPAAFLLVAACAYHHYDTVYRLRGGAGPPPPWLVRVTGGHEGRVLAVTAAAAAWPEGQGLTTALAVLGGVLALVVLGESVRFWFSTHAPAVHDETGVPG
ncbi:DUF5941 domain-containing protein [Streptomyces sp. 4N509B]|uniref:DUF5941 domain-containing protein n=1 Tax=Streptomyces sp. 4N509B TaxID=3457413 RepID=UPI003FD1123D